MPMVPHSIPIQATRRPDSLRVSPDASVYRDPIAACCTTAASAEAAMIPDTCAAHASIASRSPKRRRWSITTSVSRPPTAMTATEFPLVSRMPGRPKNDCALLDPKQVMPSARLACGGLPDCKQVHIAARNMQDEIDMIDRQWSMALERDRGGRRTCVPGRSFERRRLVGAAHSPDTSWTYSPPSASSS